VRIELTIFFKNNVLRSLNLNTDPTSLVNPTSSKLQKNSAHTKIPFGRSDSSQCSASKQMEQQHITNHCGAAGAHISARSSSAEPSALVTWMRRRERLAARLARAHVLAVPAVRVAWAVPAKLGRRTALGNQVGRVWCSASAACVACDSRLPTQNARGRSSYRRLKQALGAVAPFRYYDLFSLSC